MYDAKEKVISYLHCPCISLKGFSGSFNQTTEYSMGTG